MTITLFLWTCRFEAGLKFGLGIKKETDMHILFLTLEKLLNFQGVSSNKNAVMYRKLFCVRTHKETEV